MTGIGFLGVLWLLGCGASDPVSTCEPLRVTKDDAPYPLVNLLGVQTNAGFEVKGFDRAGIRCEDLVAKRYQSRGTTAVVASVGALSTVGFGSSYEMGISTVMLEKPKKAGDPISICVQKEVHFSAAGGEAITIVGLFAGTYCGTRE